jgi:hypothetical protein
MTPGWSKDEGRHASDIFHTYFWEDGKGAGGILPFPWLKKTWPGLHSRLLFSFPRL